MKAMIFDADGTLLDSMGLWRRIDREFLEAHHYPYSTEISEQVETMSRLFIFNSCWQTVKPSASGRSHRNWMHCAREPMKPRFRRCLLFRTF